MEVKPASKRRLAVEAKERHPPLARRLVAESFATFGITLVAIGIDVLYFTRSDIDYTARWLARGCATAAMIYAFAEISGAHADPAVTLGFALRGVFPWKRALAYTCAQFAGAFVAAGIMRAEYGDALGFGASRPGPSIPYLQAAGCEVVLTFLLVLVILATANQKAVVGRETSLAVGMTVAAAGFIGGPISGASMNPARSLAPQLLAGRFDVLWIYALAPLAGATLAVLAHTAAIGGPNEQEREAAKEF